MKKSKEIRCLGNVKTKSGMNVRCGSFLMEIDLYFIKVKCRRCGMLWLVSKDKLGAVSLKSLHDAAVISEKE